MYFRKNLSLTEFNSTVFGKKKKLQPPLTLLYFSGNLVDKL